MKRQTVLLVSFGGVLIEVHNACNFLWVLELRRNYTKRRFIQVNGSEEQGMTYK